MPFVGQPSDFIAEDEDIVAVIGGLVEAVAAEFADQPWLTITEPGEKIDRCWVEGPLQVLPIVETSPAQGFVAEIEGAGTNDVQCNTHADTQATDVAGIGWDLGLIQGEEHFSGSGSSEVQVNGDVGNVWIFVGFQTLQTFGLPDSAFIRGLDLRALGISGQLATGRCLGA